MCINIHLFVIITLFLKFLGSEAAIFFFCYVKLTENLREEVRDVLYTPD